MPRIVHFELPADDPARAEKFYSSVFGWKFQKWDGPMEYWMVMTESASSPEPGINGGMGRRRIPGEAMSNTISVSSVDEYASKIQKAGGKITVPKSAIPGVGWLAYFQDPEGNLLGMMQFDEAAK
jgi:predicted enzyme related to lactoylglutathione lyase